MAPDSDSVNRFDVQNFPGTVSMWSRLHVFTSSMDWSFPLDLVVSDASCWDNQPSTLNALSCSWKHQHSKLHSFLCKLHFSGGNFFYIVPKNFSFDDVNSSLCNIQWEDTESDLEIHTRHGCHGFVSDWLFVRVCNLYFLASHQGMNFWRVLCVLSFFGFVYLKFYWEFSSYSTDKKET